MGRYRGPKNRIARRFGVNIFEKQASNPLAHKPNPPGVHGARRKKKSDYGVQLDEKQKLKAVYGMIRERQLVNYYRKAEKKTGTTAANLLGFLECRLDVVVYRLKLAPSIFAAQQLVSHGHILVNNKKVDIRSFQVQPNMTVSVKEKSRKMKIIVEGMENTNRSVPEYLSVDQPNFSGVLLAVPEIDSVPLPLEIKMPAVCEFLAHTT